MDMTKLVISIVIGNVISFIIIALLIIYGMSNAVYGE